MASRNITATDIVKTFRSLSVAAATAALLVLSGCASYQVTVSDSDPIQPEGQPREYQKRTIHAYFWGLLPDPQIIAAQCHGQGINDVVIFRTLAHGLAGIITLGIWMPAEVGFRCKAPPTRPGVRPVPGKKSRGVSRGFS